VLCSARVLNQTHAGGSLRARGVDPAMREAARAVGMRPLQSLLHVEPPLAFPVILAGIRTATVWLVGIATLSTPVGAPSLGNHILSGLQLRDWNRLLFGCVITMLLSLVLDQLLAAVERGVQRRQPRLAWAATAMLGIVLAGGPTPSLLQRSAASLAAAAAASGTNTGRDKTVAGVKPLVDRQLTIGAKGFSKQLILADLLGRRLSAAGGEVEVLGSMGSTILFDALASGTVDVCVD
jgi:osmoprotectant transport system permease protein